MQGHVTSDRTEVRVLLRVHVAASCASVHRQQSEKGSETLDLAAPRALNKSENPQLPLGRCLDLLSSGHSGSLVSTNNPLLGHREECSSEETAAAFKEGGKVAFQVLGEGETHFAHIFLGISTIWEMTRLPDLQGLVCSTHQPAVPAGPRRQSGA